MGALFLFGPVNSDNSVLQHYCNLHRSYTSFRFLCFEGEPAYHAVVKQKAPIVCRMRDESTFVSWSYVQSRLLRRTMVTV
jgi:hypothetical protein